MSFLTLALRAWKRCELIKRSNNLEVRQSILRGLGEDQGRG